MYEVRYQKEALDDLAKLKRQEPAAFNKAVKLIDEL
jgi:mRNA-degrading endonuclease RelE of RelBE toxin-antitoxin system